MKAIPKLMVAGLIFALAAAGGLAQETVPGDKYITREEYEKLEKEMDALKAQLQQLQQKQAPQQQETEQALADIEKALKSVKEQAEASRSGTTKFLLTGYGFAGFTDRKGESSTFSAGFNPIFLWKLSDRLFFEGEIELELEGNETEVGLEYAQLSYLLNDHITLSAGKFLTPFGTFAERLHPAWINKLPDFPLAFGHDGIAPFSSLGFHVHGGFLIGPTKMNYAVYLSNGPKLNIGDEEPDEAGMLHFDNFTDVDNNKAIGARIGFLPIPQLELGYSFQYARVDASGTSRDDVDALLQAVDFSYVRDSNLLKGVVDFKAQWVWSHVGQATYDPTGAFGFGPLTFDNKRDGGYVQLAYRPTKADWKFIRDFECVGRFDLLNQPRGAPEAFDEQRWTLGLNYWLGPSTVIKAAYQFGDRRTPGEGRENVNAILLQAAMGF